ncbi:MAG: transposase [Brasilonema angustatum HA4187-MV1]|nr:transposase [Brasilonema angustatum HA4187-MV1]
MYKNNKSRWCGAPAFGDKRLRSAPYACGTATPIGASLLPKADRINGCVHQQHLERSTNVLGCPGCNSDVAPTDYNISSKKCSRCSHIQPMKLSERVFQCQNPQCGHIQDRDENAAANLEFAPDDKVRLA